MSCASRLFTYFHTVSKKLEQNKKTDLDWAKDKVASIKEALIVNIILTDKGFTPKYVSEMDDQDLINYVLALQHFRLLPQEERKSILS